MTDNFVKARRVSAIAQAPLWHTNKLATLRAMKEAVDKIGAVNLPYLCKALEMPHSTMYQYLQKLIKEKLVTYERGKGSTYRLTEKGLELADRCMLIRNGENISVIERIV